MRMAGGAAAGSYHVQSARMIPLSQLDMNHVVYPSLGANTERVTLD
ncbi:MAG: hypothetical protein U5Q44_04410 [Dehalococcoidia bacterium]|nr:hypothetical protein [Dehalococcoidia bacterium]